MTRLTALRILNDPEVHVAALGPMPNGKFGIYIGTYNTTPSGSVRPEVLLTSDGLYDTPQEAVDEGNVVIEAIRTGGTEFIDPD